jgi:hypothetical protein
VTKRTRAAKFGSPALPSVRRAKQETAIGPRYEPGARIDGHRLAGRARLASLVHANSEQAAGERSHEREQAMADVRKLRRVATVAEQHIYQEHAAL